VEYKIGYCRNASGASIAFAVSGSGPPLVCCIGGHSHLEFGWNAEEHPFLRRLSEHRTVVVYDKHGSGLSDRDRTDFSVDADRRDLEAVVDHLGLESFDLVGGSQMGPAMISYAATHPERIRHLILSATYCVHPTDSKFRESF
jgi:pimeloyl-ACP methyl ester carboxylesterase